MLAAGDKPDFKLLQVDVHVLYTLNLFSRRSHAKFYKEKGGQ
jgi:hypothetical protein